LKNTLKTKQKERITKEQHITNPCFYRWELGRLLKNTLRPNIMKGITKSSTSLNSFIGGIGRTVEKYSKTKHKERNHKEQHITQSLLHRWEWVGLLKYSSQTQRKESQKSSTSPILLYRWWVGLLKYLKTKHKERNHKRAAHHSIPAS
jgi:DNA replication protein DnaD